MTFPPVGRFVFGAPLEAIAIQKLWHLYFWKSRRQILVGWRHL